MNLFWKNLFGGLASTDKFERQMKQLADDMRRYTQVEKSAELADSSTVWSDNVRPL